MQCYNTYNRQNGPLTAKSPKNNLDFRQSPDSRAAGASNETEGACLGGPNRGDAEAAQKLWNCFFGLITLASLKLSLSHQLQVGGCSVQLFAICGRAAFGGRLRDIKLRGELR